MITHQHVAPGVLNMVYGKYVLRMIWKSSSLGERDVATVLLWNENGLIREDYLPRYDKKGFEHALYVAQQIIAKSLAGCGIEISRALSSP